MLLKPRLVFLLLFVASSIALMQVAARESEPPFHPTQIPAFREAARNARAEQAARFREQERARHFRGTLTAIERRFQIPSGTLHPAHLYDPAQHRAVAAHLQAGETRLFPLISGPEERVIFASPAVGHDPEGRTSHRGLLIFGFAPNERRIVPLGFTRVVPGVPEGDDVNFLDLVERQARASLASLQETYGALELRDP